MGAKIAAKDIPLDKAYKVPQTMSIGGLNQNGEISSRVETESKGIIDTRANWMKATLDLYQLASKPKGVESILGQGWSLIPGYKNAKTERFYVKDIKENKSLGIASSKKCP